MSDAPSANVEPPPVDGSSALAATVAVALRVNLRRLTTWVFAAVFVGIVLLIYLGDVSFAGMTASGVKLATNSDYAVAAVLGAFSFFLMHFTATLTGDPVVRDERLGLAPILRASPVGPRTYLLGRFLGGYASLLAIYAVFVGALLLGQLLPATEGKLTLPFRVAPYVKFGVLFVLVPSFFVAALSFAIGTLSGSMKAVYIAVTALLVAWFLVVEVLGDQNLRWLAYVEPSGQAWLAERVAKGRGNAWLNANPIRPDAGLLINRAVLAALGVAALAWTLRRWRGGLSSSEFGGEIRSGPLTRLLRWTLGRQEALEDRYSDWVGRGAVPRVETARPGPRAWLVQLFGSLRTELRLLGAERSLWIMVPMIMLLAGVDSVSHVGPFSVRVYPVSSEFAQQMVPILLILLSGTTIFYTGEVFHRDDDAGVRGILYASPVSNSALLLGKLGAMVLLSATMVLLTVATAVVSQAVQWKLIDGRSYLDLVPYAAIGSRVVLPAVLFLCVSSLVANVLVRGRYVGYFVCLIAGAGYVWLLVEGRRSLLVNPFALGHWAYSDLTGLGPFAQRLAWHHLYWGAVLAAALALACWLLRRTRGGWRLYASPHALRVRPWGPLLTVAFTAAAVAAGLEIRERGTLRGTRAQAEAVQVGLEQRWRDQVGAPRLAWRRLRLDVDLWPREGRVDVRGEIELANPYPQPVARALFTADPLLELRRFELEGAAGPPQRDDSVLAVPLAEPVPPGGTARLFLDWGGEVTPGWPADGGPQANFVHAEATFLSSFGAQLVPLPGVDPGLFLADRERRAAHGLGPLAPLPEAPAEGYVPALFGSDVPFDLELAVSAPAGQTVLGVGELVEHVREGERERFVYRSDHPLRSFAVLAADYARAAEGDDEIWHHPAHTYNLPTIGAALADGRRLYSERFGPYPHGRLRIAEFPRLASYAQSFPTLMPYSEAIGFLTHHRGDPRRVDGTYFVTAHEVAHQWWGYIASPGMAPGAQVLSESLAEYSAMVLIDEERGERERLVFLRQEEDAYLRRRDPDTEVPLERLQLEGAATWYNKGALVLYMLERQIGRERLHQGLAAFVARWRDLPQDDPLAAAPGSALARGHATLRDLLDELRNAHRGRPLDWFYTTWFEQVVVPDMALVGAPVVREQGGTWTVEFSATNLGQGRLPVQVEAVRGPWRADHADALQEGAFEAGQPVRLWLEPGRTTGGVVSARFRPEALVIDRLHECIDFDRTNNARTLGEPQEVAPLPAVGGPTRR